MDELITEEWISPLLGGAASHGKSGWMQGEFGRLNWSRSKSCDLILWFNGELFAWERATRKRFLTICEGFGILLDTAKSRD